MKLFDFIVVNKYTINPILSRSLFKLLFIIILILGIALRFVNLDKKFYWGDEVRTSIRVSGHTKEEMLEQLYNNQMITIGSLKKYQFISGETDLKDTFKALMTRPEHPPLYYLMARLWMEAFGNSVAVIRSLSAVISLMAFPCIYWLCLELFLSPLVGWVAIAITAVSPLHILYAQEARQYSLWTVVILLSSAALLKAIRLNRKKNWVIYGLTLILGLYSHLLFVLVFLGQGIYVLTLEGLRFSKRVMGYLSSGLIGLLLFSPWLCVMIINSDHTSAAIAEGQQSENLFYLLDRWFRNINRVFFNGDLGSANAILVIFTIYCIYFVCRYTAKPVWLFLVNLIGITAISLILPDLLLGGLRSLSIRYLIPCYLGIQLTMAYFFSTHIAYIKTWKQRFWRLVLVIILLVGLVTNLAQTQMEVVWSKDADKAKFYLNVANTIKQVNNPLIITDTSPIDVLTLSYKLDSTVKLQLVNPSYRLTIPEPFNHIFLLNPSKDLRKSFKKQRRYHLQLIDNRGSDLDENLDFWQVFRLK